MDSIYLQYNRDRNNRERSIEKRNEIRQISTTSGIIQLECTPDRNYDIVMSCDGEYLTKVEEINLLDEHTFYVDYNMAKVYFSKENYGKFVTIHSYYSRGRELIHMNRIFADSENGVVEVLEELIKNVNNAVVTKGIIKENYKTTILANQFTYNSKSELYEYTLKHNLNSNKINVGVYDMNDEACLDLCKPIDSNTLLVRNDERVDLKIVINYGSVK